MCWGWKDKISAHGLAVSSSLDRFAIMPKEQLADFSGLSFMLCLSL